MVLEIKLVVLDLLILNQNWQPPADSLLITTKSQISAPPYIYKKYEQNEGKRERV